MADLGARIGEAIGGILNDFLAIPVVRLALGSIAAYVVLLWLASAWWAFQDMRRRSSEPVAAYLGAGLVVLASPVFFPLALLVYGVLRPGRTLAETRLIRLEHEVDRLEDEELARCPGCSRITEPTWLACPECRTRLAYSCRQCGQPMGLDWTLCAWCGSEFGTDQSAPRVDPLVTSGRDVPAALVAIGPGRPDPIPAGARDAVPETAADTAAATAPHALPAAASASPVADPVVASDAVSAFSASRDGALARPWSPSRERDRTDNRWGRAERRSRPRPSPVDARLDRAERR